MTPDNLDTLSDAEINECFAVEVAGWTPWLEKRGDYTHYIWQKAGDKLPWMNYRDGEKYRQNYTKAGKFDSMKHVDHLRLVFSTDSNAVLPWLEKWPIASATRLDRGWSVTLLTESGEGETYNTHDAGDAEAPTFARAACIALIRAHRSQKATP
jgi:hypothetical protein